MKFFPGLLFFVWILVSSAYSAPNESYFFERLNSSHGLSSNIIEDIYQDSRGFLWICTKNGLNRYDGYSFKVFTPEFRKKHSFSSARFTCLTQDNEEKLWLGTRNKGINIYNKKTGKIQILSGSSGHPRLPDNVIKDLHADSQGNVWIGTENHGILRIDSTNRLINYRKKEKHLKDLQNITTIYEDRNNRIWIGSWQNGLYYYDNKNDDFVHVPLPWKDTSYMKTVVSVLHDQKGNYWIGTWGNGLYWMDNAGMKTRNLRHYSFQKGEPSNTADQREIIEIVYSIEEDENGKIWCGTNDGILIFENYQLNNPRKIEADIDDKHKPSNNQIHQIYKDYEGVLWIGTEGSGMHKVNTERSKFRYYDIPYSEFNVTREKTVYGFHELNRNILLVGLKGEGFYTYNKNSNEYTPYLQTNAFARLPYINTVCTFYQDLKDRLWLGTRYKGVFVIDSQTGEWFNLSNRYPRFQSRRVQCFMRDAENNIWIGTNQGLFIFKELSRDKKKPYKVFHYKASDRDTTSLSGNQISALLQDQNGDVWIGTGNNGLNRFSADHVDNDMSFHHYEPIVGEGNSLSSNMINDLYEDSSGNLWIGTSWGGLLRYNRDKDNFTTFRQDERLIANGVVSILEAEDSSIWLSTDKGIIELVYRDSTDYRFFNYTKEDGLQGTLFMKRAKLSSSHSNTLYFGGYNGFNSFIPSRVSYNSSEPKVGITELNFNDRNISFDPDKDGNITVNHRVKNITIEFAAFSFKNPGNNHYAYKLKGYNSRWKYTDATNRKAVYTNLPRGDYTFLVKASNHNGVWSDNPVKLGFHVKPAPYESILAFILYGLIVFTSFYFIIRTIIIRAKMKQELHLEKVMHAKKEKLNQAKLQWLTNISHEFLTPLSVISCLLDDSFRGHNLTGESVRVIQRNVKNLRNLVDQFILFRKSDAGKLKLLVSHNDLKSHMKDIYKSFMPLANKKNLHYDLSLSEAPDYCYYDRDKLEKIVYNLLSNAFKFTDSGRISLDCKAFIEDDMRRIRIVVSDTGKGIPQDKLQQIFERFFRLESTDATGAGIGLELINNLLKLHKGSIDVASDSGEGTSFAVDLPVDKAAYSDEEITSTQDLEKVIQGNNKQEFTFEDSTLETVDRGATGGFELSEGVQNKNKKSILLIEDHDDLRNVLYKSLSSLYHVESAENGEKGYDKALRRSPDLIVTDIMMPGMNGYSVCKKIKNNMATSHIPVILLTAKTGDDNKIKGYDSGADSYITKPVNLELLHTRIERLFEAWENLRRYYAGQPTHFEPEVGPVNLTPPDERYIKRAIDIIEEQYVQPDFTVPVLVRKMGTSNSMLYRKFSKIIGESPNEYIKMRRLKFAAKMLFEGNYTVSEVAYASGFNDLGYFGKCFKKVYSQPPSAYVKKEKKY